MWTKCEENEVAQNDEVITITFTFSNELKKILFSDGELPKFSLKYSTVMID